MSLIDSIKIIIVVSIIIQKQNKKNWLPKKIRKFLTILNVIQLLLLQVKVHLQHYVYKN